MSAGPCWSMPDRCSSLPTSTESCDHESTKSMKKSTSLKVSLTCSALAIGISLTTAMYHCWWLDIMSEGVCRFLIFLIGLGLGFSLIYIWKKKYA